VKSLRLMIAVIAASLLLAAMASPWLAAHGMGMASLVLQDFFRTVCHQRPERSFWFSGQPWAVCVRCSGFYAGLAIGVLLRVESRSAKKAFLAITILNAVDVIMESAELHGNLPWLRLVLGMGLGAATSVLLCSHAICVRRDRLCFLR
jgi:uncharacterized membrane protein